VDPRDETHRRNKIELERLTRVLAGRNSNNPTNESGRLLIAKKRRLERQIADYERLLEARQSSEARKALESPARPLVTVELTKSENKIAEVTQGQSRVIREPRKKLEQTMQYKCARAVHDILAKCQEAIQARRASQKIWPTDRKRWESEIRKVGFTAQTEIDILITSKTGASAAANIVATRTGRSPKSVQNARSAHKKSFQ
jgi:hypothetical protein